ncbi:hypothetical protein KC318_g8967 [Hortaea werneckii]|nr:hypothetical protein KC334_g11948 [Hortaea werneckii]KAI7004788.1 hypothetical protein KC355_g8542 [Hortaea werneckii]KAI7153395.1 hypothetical protein KC324_g14627 [Hortaea werneckii]KAI7589786.1 hypothetical protein KC316_g3742 [Hortaea werneckii]KAI7662262.1 hypothetical protein KC318_g8967 [Hortaea werneckii]
MDSSPSNLPPDYLSHKDCHPQTPPYTPLRPRSRKSQATGSALHGRKRQFSRPSPSPASTTSTSSIHPAETSSPAKKAARHRTPDVVHHSATKAAGRAETGPTDEDTISAAVDDGEAGWESENDVSPRRGPTIRSFLQIRELVEGDAGYASDLEGNVVYPEGLEEVGSGSSGSGECSSDDEAEGEDGGMEEMEGRGRVRNRSAERNEDERLSVSDAAADEDEDHISDDSDSTTSDTGRVTDRLGRLRCSNGNEEAEALFETRRRLRHLSRRMHHRHQTQENPSSPLSSDAPTTAARNGININNKRSHSQSLGASATPAPPPVPPVVQPRQEHGDTKLPPTPPFPISSAPPNSSDVFDAYNDDAPDDMVVDSDAIDDQDFPTSQRRLRRRVRGPSTSSSEEDADDEDEKRQRERGVEGQREEWRGRHMQASSSSTATVEPATKSRMSPSSAAPPFAPSSPFTFKDLEGASSKPAAGGAGDFGGFAAAVPELARSDQESGVRDDGFTVRMEE